MLQMLPKQAHDFLFHTFGNEVKHEETIERVRAFLEDNGAMMSGSGPDGGGGLFLGVGRRGGMGWNGCRGSVDECPVTWMPWVGARMSGQTGLRKDR